MKGGGPVAELTEHVRQLWLLCENLAITPTFEWVPREELWKVDALSKSLDRFWKLKPEYLSLLASLWGPFSSDWSSGCDQTLFMLPNFNVIGACLSEAQRLRRRMCLVFPCWPAQSWWPKAESLATCILELPPAFQSFTPDWSLSPIGTGPPQWRILAALFDFRRL